jgi:hypothetical protein
LAGIPDIANLENINISSLLFVIVPNTTRQPQVTLVSRHIANHLFDAALKHDARKFWSYFNQLSSVPQSRSSAGWLWKLYVVYELLNGDTRTIPLKRLPATEAQSTSSGPLKKKPRTNPTIMLPYPKVTKHGDKNALAKDISRIMPSLSSSGRLFVPGAPNQVTFDAWSVSSEGTITLYQPTIRKRHPVKAKGLDFIWDALVGVEADTQRSISISTVKQMFPIQRKWRLIFVVPESVGKHWTKAQEIDFGGIKPRRAWNGYLEQFVVTLREGADGTEASMLASLPIS